MIAVCLFPTRRLTLVKVSGSVSVTEIVAFLHRRPPEQWQETQGDTYVDMLGVENAHSYEEVKKHIDLLGQFRPDWSARRIALLVKNDLHYGVSRMFSTVMHARTRAEVGIFRTLPAAAEWLNHPLEALLDEMDEMDWVKLPGS